MSDVKSIVCTVCIALLTGCSTTSSVELTEQGQEVLVEQVPDESMRCEFVTVVTCKTGMNYQDKDHNVDLCIKQLRNKAAEAGGTHLELGAMQAYHSESAAVLTGSGKCDTCAQMSAKTYRCESRKKCLDIQDDYQECLDGGGYDPTRRR